MVRKLFGENEYIELRMMEIIKECFVKCWILVLFLLEVKGILFIDRIGLKFKQVICDFVGVFLRKNVFVEKVDVN